MSDEVQAEGTPGDDLGELEELVKEFLVESYENLDQLDRDLVTLEQDPSRETLASIFRTIHTIKGTCGWFGFSKLESVTHVGESLLSRLRDGRLQVTPENTSALLALVDAVREMLGYIEAERHEGAGDYSALIETLTRLQQETAPQAVQAVVESISGAGENKTSTSDVKSSESASSTPVTAETSSDANGAASANAQNEAAPSIGEILVEGGRTTKDEVTAAVEQQSSGDPRHVGEILVERGAVKSQDVVEALNKQTEQRAQAPQANQSASNVADNNIRVAVDLLDKLMNLVGELVIARNQILQHTVSQEDAALIATSQRLNLITTELQAGVMKTRMQPIGNVWSRFPRVVRDLSVMCGKKVRLEMEGTETELDKTIIEAIKDPLTHIVRNSVDHGVEAPDVRVAKGKAEEGHLLLRAFHEGGQVNIDIIDDGAGIDPEKMRQKGVQKGLITQEQAARMSDREAINLIFAPGFSTAQAVTNISGRGVGMDVVKTNIEKIGGTVDVQSKLGSGTTLKIKIPLTLAIIPALIITSGGDCYAIPQVGLQELVRLEKKQAEKSIEMIYGAPVYRLRGNLLPLVYLNRELGVEGRPASESCDGGKAAKPG